MPETTLSEHTQATARPWDFHIQPFEFRSGEGMDYSLMTDDGVVMFVCPPGPANAKFKANAALIVKAVNSHEALVKALIAARSHCVTLSRGHQDDVHLSVLQVIDTALAGAK